MKTPTKEEVEEFIRQNKSFFYTPLKDSISQQEFYNFYKNAQKLELIEDYSNKLRKLLLENHVAISRLGGDKKVRQVSAPVLYDWMDRNFDPALQYPAIRQFIMDNQNHPAIVLWRNRKNHVMSKEKQEVQTAQTTRIDALIKFNDCHVMPKKEQEVQTAQTTRIDALIKFDDCLEKLVNKINILSDRGHPQASKEATELLNSLNEKKQCYLNETIDTDAFKTSCEEIISTAQKGRLGTMRDFGYILQKLVSFFTGTLVKLETNTVKITNEIKQSLQELQTDKIVKKEKEKENVIPTPPTHR